MNIEEYHAHFYYSEETYEKAVAVIEKSKKLPLFNVGRMHKQNVGPHPRWSCQLLFKNTDLPDVMPWLLENRDGLTIFMHPQTGDDYADHSDHAIWIGEKLDLNLHIFTK